MLIQSDPYPCRARKGIYLMFDKNKSLSSGVKDDSSTALRDGSI